MVYFDYDMSIIKPVALADLEAHAEFLLENEQWRIRIEGHCDERGTKEYNLALGERRANAVRDWLLAKGVANSRMDVVSFGEERPAEEGSDEAAWSMNRRGVVIHLEP